MLMGTADKALILYKKSGARFVNMRPDFFILK